MQAMTATFLPGGIGRPVLSNAWTCAALLASSSSVTDMATPCVGGIADQTSHDSSIRPKRLGHAAAASGVVADMEHAKALDFARTRRRGVLVTARRDGRPQLSNVAFYADDSDVLRVSITATRAKYHNLRRDPWAAMH